MTLELARDDAFIGYPKDYVLGIFSGHVQAEAAVGALMTAGFGEADLIILTRPDDARKVDPDGTEHGVIAAAERTVEELGDKDTLDEYSKALKAGGSVVGAHTEHKEQRLVASDAMRQTGGSSIRYFGSFMVEDLDTAPHQPRP